MSNRRISPPAGLERQATHYRMLDAMLGVLDAHDGAGRAARRVSLTPRGSPPNVELRPLPPAGWPAFADERQPLRPAPGWSSPEHATSAPVSVVTLFGLDAEGIRGALDQIARQERETNSFLPVCFTDCADQSIFRRRGYVAEYFPPENSQGDAGLAHFRERFSFLWRKWGASALVDLSPADVLEPRLRDLGVLAPKLVRIEADRQWERVVPARPPMPSPDIASLRAEYAARGLIHEPDTFVLYRVIGNDLYPRHEIGQSLRNVSFILEHEPAFANCEKRWVVNRIVDRESESAVLDLLDRAGQSYIHVPFEWEDYAAQEWDYTGFGDPAFWIEDGAYTERLRLRIEARMRRHKVNYAINNNGARNVALADGRGRAKWVLPWDGNCFLTQTAWDRLVEDVTSRPYLKYFKVPMARLVDNADAFTDDLAPRATEEPQLIFRRDAEESFDEAFPYGRRPKVSLFWRLGIPGNWDIARDDVWDLPRPERTGRGAEFGAASWVARLASGRAHLETSSKLSLSGREYARNEAIVATVDHLDQAVLRRQWDGDRLIAYDPSALDALATAPAGSVAGKWRAMMIENAEAALLRGVQTVVDKTSLPPSGDVHDYWHPAPYWWPNPATLDGLPYIRRDGERVPGSELYTPDSARYDRTRIQRLFDDATVSMLAWRVTGERRFAEHGAAMLRTWFLDPSTRMNPHMAYAQWRPDQDNGKASGFGIIEMKDLYFFLDAVRLMREAGVLGEGEEERFREWMTRYLDWIRTSPHGLAERATRNNHGTCYDLQIGAIAAYLGDLPLLAFTLRSSRARILAQFAADGSQPEELKRNTIAHYTTFNVQCWTNLACLAATVGHDLWGYGSPGKGSLRAAFGLLLRQLASSYPPEPGYDRRRRIPLLAAARDWLGMTLPENLEGAALGPSAWAPIYFPHDGIKPFWLLDHLTGAAATAMVAGRDDVSHLRGW